MLYSKISLLYICAIISFTFALNIVSASDTDSLDLQRDSLLLLVEQTTDKERKTDLYNDIAYLYRNKDDAQLKKYADFAYDLAVTSKYQYGEAESLYLQAYSVPFQKKSDQSLQLLDKALSIIAKMSADTSKRLLILKANTLELKGFFLSKDGEYYESNDYYNQAFKISEQLNNDVRHSF